MRRIASGSWPERRTDGLLARQGYLALSAASRSGSTPRADRRPGGHADRRELLRVEARAAHEGAVDVLLLEDLGRVGRLHRAAGEDADAVGELGGVHLPQ